MRVRKETIGNAVLYLGDCRDVLPDVGAVGAVITDPPFGVGFKYAEHDDRPAAYDSDGGYGAWLWGILSKCEDKCSAGAPMFVWQTSLNIRQFSAWFPRDWRLFVAAKNFVQMRPTAMQFSYDPVIVWWKDGAKPWSAGTASRDFHMANTAPVVATPNNIERGHPCPRPLDQSMHIISQWCRPGSVVLDPFCGSGTTLVAAVRSGCSAVGIEKTAAYFDIACRRVESSYKQADMFSVPTERTPVTADMFA